MRGADEDSRFVRSTRNRYNHFVSAHELHSLGRFVLGQRRDAGCLQLVRDNEALQHGGVGSDGRFTRIK